MPDDFQIKIDGIDEVNKALYAYSQQLGDKITLKALREGAKVVQQQARRNAPKQTGRLRRGIVVKNSKLHSKRRSQNTIGVYLTLRGGKGREDPKDAFYGRFVEDGWNTRGSYKGSRRTISARFGKRTGRKTQPGKTNVPGKKFIKSAFAARRIAAVNLTVKLVERASDTLKKKLGFI